MSVKNPANYFAEALNRLGEPSLPLPHELPSSFTIALSREVGSGGKLVAREVARRLNWPVYDHELLEQLAKELKVDVYQLEAVDERPGNWLAECLQAFANVASVTEVTYFRRLLRMLTALGARGESVIVGRGAGIVLPFETTLRVRVVAPLKDRIALIVRERGLKLTEAAHFVETKEHERLQFIKDHFHKDLTDPLNYDLVLNGSRFDVDESAELIIQALHRLQARKSSMKQENVSQ
jgi:cytidylate kinase